VTCRAAALSDEQASQTTADDGFVGALLIETERLTSDTKASRVGHAHHRVSCTLWECFESQACVASATAVVLSAVHGHNLSTLGRPH
jgi:hypothetical protein